MKIPILYLHGFASSPRGTKVQILREQLEPEGFEFHTPDLNSPSFEKLDYDASVQRAVEAGRRNPPRVIVGSSLGALMALDVVRHGIHAPLVLIAPAIGVADQWLTKLPAGDPIKVFNYADEKETEIHRAFFDRVSTAQPDRDPPPVPVTAIMGRNDESVPFERVAEVWDRWKKQGLVPGSRLIEIPDGDHSLVSHIDLIADQIRAASRRKS